jgi:hypothetical protein
MGIVDRIFGWLMVLGSLGHSMGSIRAYGDRPELLLWAESGTLAGLLVAAMNLLRAGRPQDRTLAWVSFFASVAWFVLAFDFGRVVGNYFDIHAVIFMIITLVLAMMSLRTAFGYAS